MPVQGLAALDEELEQLPQDIRKEVKECKLNIARDMMSDLIESARVRTGRYRGSMRGSAGDPTPFVLPPAPGDEIGYYEAPSVEAALAGAVNAEWDEDIWIQNNVDYATDLEDRDGTFFNATALAARKNNAEAEF